MSGPDTGGGRPTDGAAASPLPYPLATIHCLKARAPQRLLSPTGKRTQLVDLGTAATPRPRVLAWMPSALAETG